MSFPEIMQPEKIHQSIVMTTRFGDSRSAFVASGIAVSHVTYENIVLLVNEAFDLFLDRYGFSKANIAGTNITVPSFEITYHNELKANENITIDVTVTEIGNKSTKIVFILKKSNGSIAAKARLSLIFFNYKEQKTDLVPEAFKKLFM
jgi:acyl-CoA thioesterase FadM